MFNSEVDLARLHQRDMLDEAEQRRLARRAQCGARAAYASVEDGLIASTARVVSAAGVAQWRQWLGHRMLIWGALLAESDECCEAG